MLYTAPWRGTCSSCSNTFGCEWHSQACMLIHTSYICMLPRRDKPPQNLRVRCNVSDTRSSRAPARSPPACLPGYPGTAPTSGYCLRLTCFCSSLPCQVPGTLLKSCPFPDFMSSHKNCVHSYCVVLCTQVLHSPSLHCTAPGEHASKFWLSPPGIY
jgi:hypothetical protein